MIRKQCVTSIAFTSLALAAVGMLGFVNETAACDPDELLVNCVAECYFPEQPPCDDDCVALFFTLAWPEPSQNDHNWVWIYRQCGSSWTPIDTLENVSWNVEIPYVDDPPDQCRVKSYWIHVVVDSGEWCWEDDWYSEGLDCH